MKLLEVARVMALGLVLGACSSTAAPTTTTTAVATSAPSTSSPTTVTTEAQPEVPDSRPSSPAELADALVEAEQAVRTVGSPAERKLWGERQQLLYRLLDTDRDVAAPVLELVSAKPNALAIGLNYEARVALTSLVNNYPIADNLPAWSIEEPLPAEALLSLYQRAEDETGIDWEYLAAINLVETRMGRIKGLSTAGAVGPMQFLPTTWAECCEGDPTDPADAIMGAGQYLVDRGGPQNMDKAILGYNNSRNYVTAVQAYAAVMRDDPRAYFGYHAWQVYFRSGAGLALLPVGYYEAEPVDAATWLTANPESRID